VKKVRSSFGYALAGGNLDGPFSSSDDLIVGAPYWDSAPNNNKGRIHVFWGGEPISCTPDTLESGDPALTNEHFGSSVAFIGKLVHGGPACLIAGAPEATKNFTNEGLAVVYRYQPAQ
jgi:hypothetical protein